ncbi:MAG: hypothetical protein ABI905_12640 [Betaproteobacteria bacterium]
MAPLTKILEQARVLQMRTRVGKREAIAMAMANERRSDRLSDTGAMRAANEPAPAQLQIPAASCLDALLPRNREPTMEEIREAWKDCMEQSSIYQGEGR